MTHGNEYLDSASTKWRGHWHSSNILLTPLCARVRPSRLCPAWPWRVLLSDNSCRIDSVHALCNVFCCSIWYLGLIDLSKQSDEMWTQEVPLLIKLRMKNLKRTSLWEQLFWWLKSSFQWPKQSISTPGTDLSACETCILADVTAFSAVSARTTADMAAELVVTK